MKASGIIVGITGGLLFIWHLAKVLFGTDSSTGGFTHHHLLSLVGGILMFAGIWLYVAGRRRMHRSAPVPK